MENNTLRRDSASKLLRIRVIKLQPNGPLIWALDWKSPFYCDNRKTLSYPDIRIFVKVGMVHVILKHFPEADVIAGVATVGIPQVALIVDVLSMPLICVRSKPKDHGLENLIEGEMKEGAKVMVIEDLISTGGSSLKAVEAIRKAGGDIVGMVASYTYGFPVAAQVSKDTNVKLATLTDYDHVMAEVLAMGYVQEGDIELFSEWRKDPSGWRK